MRSSGRWLLVFAFLLQAGMSLVVPSWGAEGSVADAWRHLPYDDAWIYLVYARNLLEHGYFCYNPGRPEAGATCPLWAATLAVSLAILRHPVLAARVAGLVLGAACVALVFRELRRTAGRAAAWIGAGLLALDPLWAMMCLSGMEVPLAALVTLLLIGAIRRGRPLRSGVLAGLLFLARPEMATTGAVGFVLAVWLRRRWPRAHLVRAASAGAGAAVLVTLPWLLYCRLVAGNWMSNAFHVKVAQLAGDAWPVVLRRLIEHVFWPSALVHDPLCLALIALGAWVALAALRRRPGTAAWLVLALAHVLTWSVLMHELDPPPRPGLYHMKAPLRYLTTVTPLVFGLAGLGAGRLAGPVVRWAGWLRTGGSERADRLARRALAGAPVAVLALGIASGWWNYCGGLWVLGLGYGEQWRQVATMNSVAGRNIAELHEACGRWLAENVPADAVVALQDAGAIRWFAPQRVVDIWGLNDHGMLRAADRDAYLREQGVQYLAIFVPGRVDALIRTRGETIATFRTGVNLVAEEAVLSVQRVGGSSATDELR